MKIGVSVRIDVTKIDKERLFKGEKGTYLDLTTFIDVDAKDKYDNNGFISQSVSEDERKAKIQTPILGNVKVFWKGEGATQEGYDKGLAEAKQAFTEDGGFEDADIPF